MIYIKLLRFFTIVLFLIFSLALSDQENPWSHVEPEKIDAIFEDFDVSTGGCTVGVVDNGELIFSKGYGMANLDYGIPLTPDSRLMIASISKQFAAAALLMLEQEELLDLDEDLRNYLPELPEFEEKITARQLIHHTSGLRDLFSLLHLKDLGLDPTITTDDAFELIKAQQELNFHPNTRHIYSNSGYVLMSVLTEKLSGMSFRDYTQKHFFEPLEMNATHFHDDLGMIVPNRADSYRPTADGPGRFYRDNIDRVGARGLFTTVVDFAKWDANFIENRTALENFTERMTEVGVFNNGNEHDYASGLRVSRYRTLDTVGHGGSYMGFRSNYMRFPEFQLGFIVFCNMSDINPASYLRQLADLYLMNEFEEIFNEYSGTYRNEGLGSQYRLLIEDGDLYLMKSLREKERMIWRGDDEFTAGNWEIEFQREDDSITSFTVQTGRTGKVTFTKILNN